MEVWGKFVLVGAIATALMDIQVYLHSKVFHSIPTSCNLTGRWVGMLIKREKFTGKITEVNEWAHEGWLGWVGHYAMGIFMVSLFLLIVGEDWIRRPSLLPLFAYLSVLILFPFCVLHPAWGFGFFGCKTQNPIATRKRVLVAYASFAIGILVGALIVGRIWGG